ncbi:putative transposase of IS4/5 family DUF4096 [Actinorugispora endophytica]|uniref:Putative transposase of IS4/5 family DUF4096 n=1 Tax=Actinorugispora endophytica TaxID=1605990 RepID=A0A4R6V3R3_9ACTN|nr:putative transposase of IS4/5 family DUF4096 [Actinorugispora endophytica]
MSVLVKRLVSDELWKVFRQVVPPTVVRRPQGGGRRRADDREVLAAIIFVASSGCTWRQLPPVFGPRWPTVYRRYVQWSRDRVWARLDRALSEHLPERGEHDWPRCAVDSITLLLEKRDG